jgi:hypothetical protein
MSEILDSVKPTRFANPLIFNSISTYLYRNKSNIEILQTELDYFKFYIVT